MSQPVLYMPTLYMIAGPNGSGKTTTAMKLLPKFLNVYEFINADEIARGLNPLNPEGQAITAGKIMLKRLDSLIAAKKSFAFESTGSSLGFAKKIKIAKQQGYKICLVFLWLPNVDFAKSRVKMRVAQGGHNIPEADIKRRYHRGLKNLIGLYLPLADEATLIDATTPWRDARQIIADKHYTQWDVHQQDLWHKIEKIAGGRNDDNA